MSTSSLGALSPFVIQHEPERKDDSAIDISPGPIQEIPSLPGSRLTSASQYDLRGIPTYLSDRSRRPSARSSGSGRNSFSKDSIRLEVLRSNKDNVDNDVESVGNADLATSVATPSSTAPLSGPRVLTPQQKKNSLLQFLAVCWCIYVVGWNDGTTGPLLPRMQEEYQVGFTIISMVFVGNCVGYVIGAALNIWLNDKIGFGKTITLGAVCQLVAYIIIAPAPPFPVLVCAYAIDGFGLALEAAQGNGFVGSLQDNMATKLGVMHGAYGLGAFTSPFASTYFSQFKTRKWAFHFIISAALCVINIVVLISVFQFRRQEDILLDAGQEHIPDTSSPQAGNKYRQILRIKAVHLITVFALIYIGVEVTLGGWIVTFIIRERDGGSSSGYISSGFFGGLTLGRVSLMWLNKLVGEYRIIFVYSIIAIGLELTVWFVPSIIENAVAISLVGLVLGPMFPLLVQHMTNILPRWLLTGSVGLVAGIGVAGSAALPFITGLLASKFGIGSLQPLMISMMGTMLLVWAFIPKSRRAE